MNKILGWVPDADPTTLGALPDGSFEPTSRGIQAPRAHEAYGSTAATVGLYSVGNHTLLNGTTYNFTGSTGLWRLSTSGWTDVTRLAGAYSSSLLPWSFASIGDTCIAADGVNAPQFITGTGANFADLSGIGIALVAAATTNFAFLCNFSTVDTTDTWACSAINAPTSWAVSVSTQATRGRLVAPGGPITAALALGEQIVIYKENAIYVGSYVGPPEVWRFQLVSNSVGCVGQSLVCDIGGAHIFADRKNRLYLFDGVRPTKLGDGVYARTLAQIPASTDPTGYVVYDRIQNRVFYKRSIGDTTTYVLDLESNRAGLIKNNGTFGLGVNVRHANLVSNAGNFFEFGALFGSTNTRPARLLNTSGADFSFTTHAMGSPSSVSMCRGIRLMMPSLPPAIASVNVSATSELTLGAMDTSANATPSPVSTDANGRVKIDFRRTGYWHVFNVSVPGTNPIVEATAYDAELVPAGMR